MAEPKGLLINYSYCTGCYSCEMSCSTKQNLPLDQWGIKQIEIGPWQIDKKHWEYDCMAIPTDQCNLCEERTARGKLPLCVQHCQAKCMYYGTLSELVAKIDGKSKFALFVPQSGTISD